MRVKTLEIRWHDALPIYASDYQPLPVPQLRKLLASRMPTSAQNGASSASSATSEAAKATPSAFRLATSGGDNNVRIWMVHPNILPQAVRDAAGPGAAEAKPHPPRVEYLATLSKHTATVNVVRWSPNGELLASAGDDGMIAIWGPSDRPAVSYGSDPEETQYGKEFWRVRTILRCTTHEVYDLAWSPNGEYIIAGSTDNTARIFTAADGTCVREITEHSHYVQGVAWDPLNEFIATQSSDRSVHVYSISTKRTPVEVHAVGKNTRMPVRHSRTPSGTPAPHSRPTYKRRSSTTSDVESVSEMREEHNNFNAALVAAAQEVGSIGNSVPTSATDLAPPRGPPTPSPSIGSSASAVMFPPKESASSRSRRSSFSSAAGAASPVLTSNRNFGRSPSPMPPLPAIRTPISTPSWASMKLYGDEGFTNFFRRLTFSPDGGLLLTPAGHFEDPAVEPGRAPSSSKSTQADDPPVQPKKSSKTAETSVPPSSSSVYIYSRANFARPPIAHLPGHKTASVAVKFSPVLYELRPNVAGPPPEAKKVVIELGKEHDIELEIGVTPLPQASSSAPPSSSSTSNPRSLPHLSLPSPAASLPPSLPSPSLSTSSVRARTPQPVPPPPVASASLFALPYRMLYAVATQDTVMIYDTQQAGPLCLFTNLHYSSFTDVTWAPDGQSLILASSDGYCSIIIFDEYLPLYHTQQHNMQLQAIASSVSTPQQAHHALPPNQWPAASSSSSVADTPHAHAQVPPTPSRKRREPPLTPSEEEAPASGLQLEGAVSSAVEPPAPVSTAASASTSTSATQDQPPKKKKRRIQLTHHGDVE